MKWATLFSFSKYLVLTCLLWMHSIVLAGSDDWLRDPIRTRELVTWLKQQNGLGYIKDFGYFVGTQRLIQTGENRVWNWIRNPNFYQQFSSVITAHVNGKVQVGEPISLEVRLWKNLPGIKSVETISNIDEYSQMISWEKKLGSGMTQRPQIIFSLSDTQSVYASFLVLPDNFEGWLTFHLLGTRLKSAFDKFSRDLKTKLESSKQVVSLVRSER